MVEYNVARRYRHKEDFIEAIEDGFHPYLIDPSKINPQSGRVEQLVDRLGVVFVIHRHYVEDWHWTARIYRSKRTGKIIVE